MPPKSATQKSTPGQTGSKKSPALAPEPAKEPFEQQYESIPTEDLALRNTQGALAILQAHRILPASIKVGHDGVRGRFLGCVKPIKAGVSILPEDANVPYASALCDEYIKKCCANCNELFTPKTQPIQCKNCNLVLCCSRKCFNELGTLHVNECEALTKLPELQFQGDTVYLRVLIRAILIHRLQELYQEEQKLPIAKRNKNLAGFRPNPNGPLWDDLGSLMTHSDKLSPSTINDISKIFTQLQKVLPFGWWNSQTTQEAAHLYLTLLINKFPLQSNNTNVGFGLYVLPSYFNHSDGPNCCIQYGAKGRISIRTLRDIRIGEELTIAYTSLYSPSFTRRQTLSKLYHFDPCIEKGTRTDPAIRIKDDYHIAGMKCTHCDTGVLNYHQVKHWKLPLQNSVLECAPKSATSPTPTANADDRTPTSGPSVDDVKPDDVATKPWFALDKPTSLTHITCSGCDSTYPVNVVDNWLDHVFNYFMTSRNLLSDASKYAEIHSNLQNNVVSLMSKPKEPTTADKKEEMLAFYGSDEVMKQVLSAKMTAPFQLFRLVPTHHHIYNAYLTILYIARQQQDFISLNKYAQLVMVQLSNPMYAQYLPEYADILSTLADYNTFVAGSYVTVTGINNSRARMLVNTPQDVTLTHNTKAQELYQQSLELRKKLYGTAHDSTIPVQERLTRLNEILKPATTSPVGGKKGKK